MNNQWYAQEGWYEPLQHEEKAAHRPDRHESEPKPKRKKRKGLTPARIAGLVVLLLLLIAGSSLAVGGLRSDSAPQDSGFGVEIRSAVAARFGDIISGGEIDELFLALGDVAGVNGEIRIDKSEGAPGGGAV